MMTLASGRSMLVSPTLEMSSTLLTKRELSELLSEVEALVRLKDSMTFIRSSYTVSPQMKGACSSSA